MIIPDFESLRNYTKVKYKQGYIFPKFESNVVSTFGPPMLDCFCVFIMYNHKINTSEPYVILIREAQEIIDNDEEYARHKLRLTLYQKYAAYRRHHVFDPNTCVLLKDIKN